MGKRKHETDVSDDSRCKRSRQSSSSSSSSSSSDMEPDVKQRRKHSAKNDESSTSQQQTHFKDKDKVKHKHKHKRKRSTDASKKTKKKKKKAKKEHKKHRRSHDSSPECFGPRPPSTSESQKVETAKSIEAGTKKGMMAPMTKEEWEKERNTLRHVYDPETGRNRLVRGSGEILEEIVSKKSHTEINKRATMTDGLFYQFKAGELSKSTTK